ncbi:predicted signal transduction protein [Vibrio astriarenae]|uniref:HDOD domain-containing protein n=1 Tax=Vibrio astriarenae TaxID=1481923 RepID=A0A7Z2T3V4_9VIBR|nr:HDOD domain-containing protein [Vibrio astriarenae]QIA63683.1 HDOD domain-containing protein [Vibrio astriarenae]GAL12026.1 predicted signal transduction protein [Vibrio sp. C7]
MQHLSFFWLSPERDNILKGLESEFFERVKVSISSRKISLPPIPEAVITIQRLSIKETTNISDIAECLLEDPSLAATVIKVANSVIFNRRNITCTDLVTAVSRLGILRVRDIVTAQAIEQLKLSVKFTPSCKAILAQSAHCSRDLGATMVLVLKQLKELEPESYRLVDIDKALLVGLLADIGLFSLVNEYHFYLEEGNYLNQELALPVFESLCSGASELVLQNWGFDYDFINVATNRATSKTESTFSYLDLARVANHVLLHRKGDESIDDHFVEIDANGAEVLYNLSNLDDSEFSSQLADVLMSSGL